MRNGVRFGKHRDVDIFVKGDGTFTTDGDQAELGEITGKTLDELKKKIDAAGKATKQRHPGFMLPDHWGRRSGGYEIVPVTVTSLVMERYGGREAWVVDNKKTRSKVNASSVYQDTQENRGLAAEWSRHRKIADDAERECESIRTRLATFRGVDNAKG